MLPQIAGEMTQISKRHAVCGKFFDDDDGFGHASSSAAVFLGQVQPEQARGPEVFPQFFDAAAGSAAFGEVLHPVARSDVRLRSHESPCAPRSPE